LLAANVGISGDAVGNAARDPLSGKGAERHSAIGLETIDGLEQSGQTPLVQILEFKIATLPGEEQASGDGTRETGMSCEQMLSRVFVGRGA
jgi:hypothetical protein